MRLCSSTFLSTCQPSLLFPALPYISPRGLSGVKSRRGTGRGCDVGEKRSPRKKVQDLKQEMNELNEEQKLRALPIMFFKKRSTEARSSAGIKKVVVFFSV